MPSYAASTLPRIMPTTIAIIEDNQQFLRHLSTVVEAGEGLSLLGAAGSGRDGMALIERGRADL
jgi:predicted ABC-type transport system involved in lysophospholipase L1 biosynthesis ATPase subunit